MTKSVLIVEDDKPTLGILADKISSDGFRVIKAEDGQEGLTKALAEHPDLILLDMMLPKLSGMGLLQKLRRDSWGKSAPVLILTNLSETSSVASSVAVNAVGYFVKSDWKLEDIAEQVKFRLQEN